jgi:hypothetical protein
MHRSPSLPLAAVLLVALASPAVRGEVTPLPPAPPPVTAPDVPPPHAPQIGYAPAPIPAQRPRRKTLMIGGLATFGAGYLLSLLAAMDAVDHSTNGMTAACSSCKAGPRLLIPIAGPWLAMPYANTGRDDQTLYALLGLAQATGVVLAIIGISQFVADAPRTNEGAPVPAPRQSRSSGGMTFGLLPTRDGAFGFASARF